MPLVLTDLDRRVRAAVAAFWKSQDDALRSKAASGKPDTGNRGAVTRGRHLDGFVELIREIVAENGLSKTDVLTGHEEVAVPGFFRATKDWDVLVIHRGVLVAAIELKSMGSSFGKNLNNRAEEVLGQSLDFLKSHENRLFRDCPRPFLGYCVILADEPAIHMPVKAHSPHFPVLSEFVGASYAKRFNVLCRKMVGEGLYSEAALVLSERNDGLSNGGYRHIDESTSFLRFVSGLAAHVARVAAISTGGGGRHS